jgi:hypothetical protein
MRPMSSQGLSDAIWGLTICVGLSADFQPAPQQFRQEIAQFFTAADGAPTGAVQLIECAAGGLARAFADGRWHEFRHGR